jgi:hypothetical protein
MVGVAPNQSSTMQERSYFRFAFVYAEIRHQRGMRVLPAMLQMIDLCVVVIDWNTPGIEPRITEILQVAHPYSFEVKGVEW